MVWGAAGGAGVELWPDEGMGGVEFDRRGGRAPMGVRQRSGQPGQPNGAVEGMDSYAGWQRRAVAR